MEEKRQDEITESQESFEDTPDPARREFVTKLVTAAGIAAVAGLAGAASADTIKTDKDNIVNQKVGKFRNGFQMEFSGKPICDAMVQAGIAPAGTNTRNARLTITFTAD